MWDFLWDWLNPFVRRVLGEHYPWLGRLLGWGLALLCLFWGLRACLGGGQ